MKKITFLFVSMLIAMNLFAGAVTVVIPNGSGQTEINAAMTDAVAASNTDITLQFEDGGVYGALAAPINSITVPAGVTKLTLTALNTVSVKPILYLDQIIYSDALMTVGITLDNLQFITAVADAKYLIQNNSANIPAKITIKNCYVKGYRAVVLIGAAVTINEIVLYNNVLNSIGGNGVLNVSSAATTISKVTIRNNTYDCGERLVTDYFVVYRTTLANLTTFDFSKNIVYFLASYGRGFIRQDVSFDASNPAKFNSNLFVPKTISPAPELRMAYATGYVNIATSADSTNYYSSNYSTTSPTRATTGMIFTKYIESVPSILFVSPTDGNFFINDTSYPGSTAVGANWNKLVTSVNSAKTSSFVAYPNPTSDVVYFNKNYAQIEVISLIGKTLQIDKNTKVCYLNNFAKGTYLIRTTDDAGNKVSQKITKH